MSAPENSYNIQKNLGDFIDEVVIETFNADIMYEKKRLIGKLSKIVILVIGVLEK